MNLIHVQLTLTNPNLEEGSNASGLDVSLCFTDQPSAADVIEAFKATPTVSRRPDYQKYYNVLLSCLGTYGVPKLGKYAVCDTAGTPIEVPMVSARWFMNVLSQDVSASDLMAGTIRVSRRVLHEVTYPAPPLKEVKAPEPARRKRPIKTKNS